MAVDPFSYTLASTTLNAQKVQFELQFNLLQNSLINRHNEKIEKISTTPQSVENKIEDLSKRQRKLVDAVPALADFRQGNLNNKGALEKVFDEISTLFQTFNQDANVDADEVAAFEAQRDVVAQKIENLYVFTHNDINDGKVIQRLKQDVEAIRSLTLSVGTLTSNSAVSDSLTALQSEVGVAITVTQNTASTALDLQQSIESKFATIDADLIELTSDEKVRREQEINDAETVLGNLLRAISLSFEINSGLSQALANRLKPFTPPPGSAVNIIS
ncbi:MAG: hypothetical protein ABJ388_10295 [Alphaproteobacteria bacterium]|uniref:hypothetical protein n=1 Tax=Nisaea sp. TaxID=2024842 RepID=UPI003266ED58|tara:strand:+ start:5404 stop:6225 length:822 start_codon:yes stop_codon:yes gene_type:complete